MGVEDAEIDEILNSGVSSTNLNDGRLYVREANKEGWDFVKEGSIFDVTYQNSNTRRGRVIQQGKVCPTLTCKSNGNMVVFEGFINE